jgi:endonuclease/exonuclease/phosphatase family metal-dependent hydrolase
MPLRIGTFNVENLFRRSRALNSDDPAMQTAVSRDIRRLNVLINRTTYTQAVKTEMVQILARNQVHRPSVRPFFINEVREKLFSHSTQNGFRITASGRAAWTGWVDVQRDPVSNEAVLNTARVIQAVNPHVLCVVEVEDRQALEAFNHEQIPRAGGTRYPFHMLVEGNDDRGIDVGILSRFPIRNMRSHIFDPPPGSPNAAPVFSRDCPEYELVLPNGASLWVLCNHFKSRIGGGGPRRLAQATRVSEILAANFSLANDLVVVAGDLNDTPADAPLQPLLGVAQMHDVLDSLPAGSPRFTFHSGQVQFDYLLVSDPMRNALQNVGIERRGMFSATNFGGAFPHFPQVTSNTTAASDHALVFVDVAVGGVV